MTNQIIHDLLAAHVVRTSKLDQLKKMLAGIMEDEDCLSDPAFCQENFPHLLEGQDGILDSFSKVNELNQILLEHCLDLPSESIARLRERLENFDIDLDEDE